jgi:hypothetical protein
MLLAFSMLLGIYSTLLASGQLEDHIPIQVNHVAAANMFLASVFSKSVSEKSYHITQFSSQANLDGYLIISCYRSDRGVVLWRTFDQHIDLQTESLSSRFKFLFSLRT